LKTIQKSNFTHKQAAVSAKKSKSQKIYE